LQARLRLGVCFSFLIASPVINEGLLLVLLRHQSGAHAALFMGTAFLLSVGFGVLADRLGMARFVKALPTGSVAGAVQVNAAVARTPWPAHLRFAARSARLELKSSAPYLAVGIGVGAVIYGQVPQDALLALKAGLPAWALIFAMALAGVPFYVSPAMVVPIALALLEKGLGIGPAAAFLVAAAGTSVPEMILLTRLFKAPLVAWHALAIVTSATVIGLLLDHVSPSL
jgi:uncharacterized protein